METPYAKAFMIPFLLLCPCFVKKETVSGIMGKTQGVNKAMNPPSNPKIKIPTRLLFSAVSSPQLLTGLFISIVSILILVLEATPPCSATWNGNRVGYNSSPHQYVYCKF